MLKIFLHLWKDLLWLITSAFLTILFAYWRYGNSITDDTLDLHLYDTFYVFSRWLVLIPLFLLVTFLLFFIKTRFTKTNTGISSIIFILSGLALGISITFIIKTCSVAAIVGFTIYPPLSALGRTEVPPPYMDQFSISLINFLTMFQSIVFGIVIYSTYRFGNKKNTSEYFEN